MAWHPESPASSQVVWKARAGPSRQPLRAGGRKQSGIIDCFIVEHSSGLLTALLRSRCCAKRFAYTNLFNPHKTGTQRGYATCLRSCRAHVQPRVPGSGGHTHILPKVGIPGAGETLGPGLGLPVRGRGTPPSMPDPSHRDVVLRRRQRGQRSPKGGKQGWAAMLGVKHKV